jgi:4a-hydroxytetrahydrobiopterin dehydratase
MPGVTRLGDDEICARLAEMPGWSAAPTAIARTYRFPSFADAITFVTRLAFDAEAADHHPDLLVQYRRVTVTWTTKSAGGVTDKDFAGARQADEAAGRATRATAR